MKRRIAKATSPARSVFRKEVGAAVNQAVGPQQAGVESELRDLRRVLTDDMDATNESTAVFGRLLSRLADRLDAIEERLAQMNARLDALEPVAPAPATPPPVPGVEAPGAKRPRRSGVPAPPGD